jgi:hypothetical protein
MSIQREDGSIVKRAGDFNFSVNNLGIVAKALQAQCEKFANNADLALQAEAAAILVVAKALCPVEHGTLRDSGRVIQHQTKSDKLTGNRGWRVAFGVRGSGAEDYARWVHFKRYNKRNVHRRVTEGGKRKFKLVSSTGPGGLIKHKVGRAYFLGDAFSMLKQGLVRRVASSCAANSGGRMDRTG